MTDIRRVFVTWTGTTGLPGVSVFYSLGSDDATASLGTFFNAIKGLIPNVVQIGIPGSGDKLEHTTGKLSGSWAGGTSASIAGTAPGAFAAGVGLYVRWGTNTIRAGRKFVGRTFICPINSGLFDAQGTIATAPLSTVQTAANALVAASPTIVIYGRPHTGLSDGIFAGVTSALAPDVVTSLRSRRV